MTERNKARIEIGNRIRELRKSRGKNLVGLAGATEISSGYLSDIERGESALSGEKLASIARVLDTSVDYLLSGENAPTQNNAPEIIIPIALSEAATTLKLTYEQTIRLLNGRKSLVARRSNSENTEWTEVEWIAFHTNVKDYL